MFNPTLLNHIDALKARLDRLRPLPPELVDNLREVYDIRLTYHSNAIEGNTLTQSETQIVVEKGITIGGKPLKDHLEAINHVEAIDFIRDLAMDERAISEWDIRQIHGLVCKGERGAGGYRTVNVIGCGQQLPLPRCYSRARIDAGIWRVVAICTCFASSRTSRRDPLSVSDDSPVLGW
jgi:Fic family protein